MHASMPLYDVPTKQICKYNTVGSANQNGRTHTSWDRAPEPEFEDGTTSRPGNRNGLSDLPAGRKVGAERSTRGQDSGTIYT